MKILLIPLDERPCNRIFPKMICNSNESIELKEPNMSLLGRKKTAANSDEISDFLYNNIHDCDSIVLSIDMLVYGGLIPSRLHHLEKNEAIRRLKVIKRIKESNPKIKIYAFNCIMRAPSYDSSEEEPDYYQNYGYALFRRKYLLDYKNRHGLDEIKQQELDGIKIPQEIVNDYESRRDFNTMINLEVVKYLEEGYIDFLVIPQDDSSPYGYTAISQKVVIDEVKKKKLDMKAMIYPGADEVAMSLLARAYNEYLNVEPKVYPFYSSVLGPTIVPKYEDRPMFESLKSHIRACKARIVDSAKEADIILAINSPGKVMQESFIDKNDLDITYTSYRNLLDFAYKIKDFINEGYKVALCDSAFSNGGDVQLIDYLDEMNILDSLVSYAGWNTNCNSLGTTLAQAFIGGIINTLNNLCYRIIEDVFYQSIVRKSVVENDLVSLGLSYYDFKDQQDTVENIIEQKLQSYYDSMRLAKKYPVIIKKVYMPWRRMFEVGLEIEVKKNA
ncbi:DUF4127 family protein [Clostridium sp.]|uniref:DUF4127 family protein n=1 Tax=Clostridium sp. TaxID=1506 RepID=UPI00290DD4C5|nr:DUF4127 family protein [Clostridium sp.]MDU7215123.1 DUF4127 family protein [Clostridium sp.]